MKKLWAMALALALMLTMVGSFAAADSAEPVTLKLYFGDTKKTDGDMVAEKLSEYTLDKINAKVEFVFFGAGEFNTKVPLLIASDEQMDIGFDAGWIDYVGRSRAGAYLEIGDYLNGDYTALRDAVDPLLWQGATVDGGIYGVPTYKELAETWALYAETEFLENEGIDPATIKSLEDGEVILEALAKYPERAGFQILAANYANILSLGMKDNWDYITVDTSAASVVSKTEPTTVVNLYETEEFEALCGTLHDWYEKGYIAADVATRENYNAYIKDSQNYGLGYVSYSPQNEVGATKSYGKSLTPMCVTPITTSNGSVTGSLNCVYAKCQNPEAALAFLQLWNTDSYVKNMITFGIEGVHYNLVDGKVQTVDGIGDLYVNQNWRTGNMFISYLTVSESDDKYQQYLDFNAQATASVVLGFNPLTDAVSDKIVNCKAVTTEYLPLLMTGAIDPAEYLPLFIEALKGAGVDDIIYEFQTQLDAWRAAQ